MYLGVATSEGWNDVYLVRRRDLFAIWTVVLFTVLARLGLPEDLWLHWCD